MSSQSGTPTVLLSWPTRACPRNLNEGDGRYEKPTDRRPNCIKLGPGRLGARMETHQHPHPSAFIIYSSNMRWRGISWRGHDIVILRNRRNPWHYLSEWKHVGKNSCTASCPLLQLRLCQSNMEVTGNNYTWSLLCFGAVPNSNTQLVQYTCHLPTSSHFNFLNVRDEACPLNPRSCLCTCSIWLKKQTSEQ
jgi:hypothetical protein